MVVETGRRPVEALARAAGEIAAASDLEVALGAVAGRVAEALNADLVVVRVADRAGVLVARAVEPAGSALAAQLALSDGAEATQRVADRVAGAVVETAPALSGSRTVGSVDVIRLGEEPSTEDRAVLELAAGLVALAVRTIGAEPWPGVPARPRRLEAAGAALAASGDPRRLARHSVEVAVEVTRARAGMLWRLRDTNAELIASVGSEHDDVAEALVGEACAGAGPVTVEKRDDLPAEARVAVTFTVGRPPLTALQLFYAEETVPSDDELPALAAFAARAAQAILAGEQSADIEAERDRARSLLEVVAASIARLSLAHVLETAVERVGELLPVGRVGVYLREHGSLRLAAGRGLTGGHAALAEDVLELALGPLRARDVVRLDVADGTRALGVPLRVRDEPIGLLVAYPRTVELAPGDVALLTSLASQLAVAVQNARLHERATELGDALADALESEREASQRVRALLEISNAAQSLSLESTLRAVAATTVEQLGADAAVLWLRDERGNDLVHRSSHVVDARLEPALQPILDLAGLSAAHPALAPFLQKGGTALDVVVPVAPNVAAEMLVLSLDPARPVQARALTSAGPFLQQAGLAIDNARLHEQQKQFAETMQRSLLPREPPSVDGLDVGAVYESAGQVDVGGDVFDFLVLADGRLAVVLGDVTGHGVAATADMAMAKFVFRSLAREHPEPSEFLRFANDVVADEVEPGAFVTMAYVVVAPDGTVECACAGHPRPRLIGPDGEIRVLDCNGLALGIERAQVYEQVATAVPADGALVLYTDGVVEARRRDEQFGVERLDAVLQANRGRPAQAIADAVVSSCRAFAGGELGDDCAIVVLRRT